MFKFEVRVNGVEHEVLPDSVVKGNATALLLAEEPEDRMSFGRGLAEFECASHGKAIFVWKWNRPLLWGVLVVCGLLFLLFLASLGPKVVTPNPVGWVARTEALAAILGIFGVTGVLTWFCVAEMRCPPRLTLSKHDGVWEARMRCMCLREFPPKPRAARARDVSFVLLDAAGAKSATALEGTPEFGELPEARFTWVGLITAENMLFPVALIKRGQDVDRVLAPLRDWMAEAEFGELVDLRSKVLLLL